MNRKEFSTDRLITKTPALLVWPPATSCLSLEFLRLPTPSTLLDEHGSGDPLFWNAASAWEGEEVKVMRIQSLAAASGMRGGPVCSHGMQAMT